jgi:DNA-binding NarL/FixJ family response regulator
VSSLGRPLGTPGTLRVLVVVAQRAFAEALGLRLGMEEGVEVVAAVAQREEAMRIAGARPGREPLDVAVVDVDAEALVGLGDQLQEVLPPPALVALSDQGTPAVLTRAVRHGFRGWVPKDGDPERLLEVIRAVRRGETCIPPLLLTGMLGQLLQEEAEERSNGLLLAPLTRREREVLQAMTRGADRQEISEDLGISPNTVRTHSQNILSKLGVHSSLAAVRLARRAGLT